MNSIFPKKLYIPKKNTWPNKKNTLDFKQNFLKYLDTCMHPFNLENYFYKVNLHNQVKKYLFLKQTMVLFLQIRNIFTVSFDT